MLQPPAPCPRVAYAISAQLTSRNASAGNVVGRKRARPKRNDPPKRLALWRIGWHSGRPNRSGIVDRLSGCGLGGGRHRRDGLEDLRSNLIGVALRIRAA